MVELLDGLDEERASEYNLQWMQAGIVLKNEGYECAMWDAWSQRRCPAKYQAGACERKWTRSTRTLWLQADDADLARRLLARKHGVKDDEDLTWLGAPHMWRPYQLMHEELQRDHFYHEAEAAVGRMLTQAERITTTSDLPFRLWPSIKAKEAQRYSDDDENNYTAPFLPLWLVDPRRRTVRGVVFEPDVDRAPADYLNLYTGPVAASYEPPPPQPHPVPHPRRGPV